LLFLHPGPRVKGSLPFPFLVSVRASHKFCKAPLSHWCFVLTFLSRVELSSKQQQQTSIKMQSRHAVQVDKATFVQRVWTNQVMDASPWRYESLPQAEQETHGLILVGLYHEYQLSRWYGNQV
jgi:hypothetical protein